MEQMLSSKTLSPLFAKTPEAGNMKFNPKDLS
jgi:hypothetical protein